MYIYNKNKNNNNVCIHSNLRGDSMKCFIKDLSLIMVGATMVLLYQRYNEEMMEMAINLIDKCKCNKLEN